MGKTEPTFTDVSTRSLSTGCLLVEPIPRKSGHIRPSRRQKVKTLRHRSNNSQINEKAPHTNPSIHCESDTSGAAPCSRIFHRAPDNCHDVLPLLLFVRFPEGVGLKSYVGNKLKSQYFQKSVKIDLRKSLGVTLQIVQRVRHEKH